MKKSSNKNLQIIENLKDLDTNETNKNILMTSDSNLDESSKINVFRRSNRIKNSKFVCLKKFNIIDNPNNEDSFDIEDVAIESDETPTNEGGNGFFNCQICKKNCGNFLRCPEMDPINCEVFKKSKCDCVIKCEILEKKFKNFNHIN